MRQVIFLQIQQGSQQRAAGHHCQRIGNKPQLLDWLSKMTFQQLLAAFQPEQLLRPLVHTAAQPVEQGIVNHISGDILTEAQHLAGGKSPQLRCNRGGIGADGGIKCAGGNIAEGQAEAVALTVEAGHIVIFIFVQHTAFRNRARGDNAGDVPLHQALYFLGILHLLAHRHLVALLHHAGNVGIHAVIGHAAHRSLLLLWLGAVTGGQGQIQLPGGQDGILIEHLVKVAQAEKQNAVLVFFLQCPVLLLHWGQLCVIDCHDSLLRNYSASLPVRLQVVAPVISMGQKEPIRLSAPAKRTSRPPSVRAVRFSPSRPSTRQRSVFPI